MFRFKIVFVLPPIYYELAITGLMDKLLNQSLSLVIRYHLRTTIMLLSFGIKFCQNIDKSRFNPILWIIERRPRIFVGTYRLSLIKSYDDFNLLRKQDFHLTRQQFFDVSRCREISFLWKKFFFAWAERLNMWDINDTCAVYCVFIV